MAPRNIGRQQGEAAGLWRHVGGKAEPAEGPRLSASCDRQLERLARLGRGQG